MSTRVENIKDYCEDVHTCPDEYVYVGRGSDYYSVERSVWGNPYKVGVHGNRQQVIELYRLDMLAWKERDPEGFQAKLETLRGKVLVCHCAPQPCHADVLIELLGEGEPKPVQMGMFAE